MINVTYIKFFFEIESIVIFKILLQFLIKRILFFELSNILFFGFLRFEITCAYQKLRHSWVASLLHHRVYYPTNILSNDPSFDEYQNNVDLLRLFVLFLQFDQFSEQFIQLATEPIFILDLFVDRLFTIY